MRLRTLLGPHVLVVLAIVLAGCNGPDGPGGGPTGTTTAPPDDLAGLDGAAMMDFLVDLVGPLDDLRDRTPGDDDHLATSAWLADRFDAPGWNVSVQPFTGEDYLRLDAGAVASYQTRCPEEDREELPGLSFRNVIAHHDAPGTDRTVLLGAHWDAKEEHDADGGPVPGANDGASGVAVLHGLVHAVGRGDWTPQVDLLVVLFDGEDGFEDCHPLAGSIVHARTLDRRVDQMLLLDMVGDPDARFVREQRSVAAAPLLMDVLWDHGRARLPEAFTDIERSVLDDHVPYIEEDIPAADLIDFGRPAGQGKGGFPPYWHTPEDTPDKLDPDMLEAVASIVVEVLDDPRLIEAVDGRSGRA